MNQTQKYSAVQLHSRNVSLIIDCRGRTPAIAYWGKRLNSHSTDHMINLLATRQEAKCSVVKEAPISLSPMLGQGFTGAPGIELMNGHHAWSIGGDLVDVQMTSDQEVTFESVDKIRQIRVIHSLLLDEATDVLVASTAIKNEGDDDINVNSCAAPTLPIPHHLGQIMSFEGRWSNEFQQHSIDKFLGSFLRENRKGKTSHDNFPGVVLHEKHTHEQAGECYGLHLGWSGNNRIRVEQLAEGRNYAQLGELLLPGEVILKAGQQYQSPNLYAAYSDQGFSSLSRCFHQFVRANILTTQQQNKIRPVHYNTWEGIYFDHDVETLKALADKVVTLGIERFVLDDGWFKGRRGDYAGLGDWVVDKAIYPQGLAPIIDHVVSHNMEFGLWFEPEMVNPDSDLYRAHPEWVLSTQGNEQLVFRNQLVLDLTRQEVCDYLYNQISDILTQYPKITYIKWDINRDLNHAGDSMGRPAVHRQTYALYSLIDRIKASHSHVEIESCSSGGARVDFGVLGHTDRVWTSDSNDALDRLSIQRGCSMFFPAEVMGSHVGPRDCHITGRRVSMEMRAAVAFFGHMGIEMDPRELTDDETKLLQQAISLHKKYRGLIHSAELVRLNSDGDSIDFGLVNDDKTQALFAYNSINETKRTTPPKLRFSGLDVKKCYTLDLIWPTVLKEYSPSVLGQVNGQQFSGELLMQFGLQLPVLFPQSSLIFSLTEHK